MRSIGRGAERRGVAVVAMALAVALVVAGCGDKQGGGGSGGGDGSLKIALYPGSLISFPARVADAEGIFEKHDLDIGLIDVAGGPNATAAVASGSADIQLNSTDNNMLSRSKGQDMIAVAGNTDEPIFSIAVNKDVSTPNAGAGFPDSIRDLKGTKIGVTQRGASVELVMQYLLQKAGLDPKNDVTFLAVGPPPTALPALEHKRIDAYVAFEPVQTQAVDIQKFASIVLDLRGGDLPPELRLLDWDYNQWAALAGNVKSKRETFDRFQAAMKDTFAFIEDPKNFDTLVDIGLKTIADDQPLVTKMLKNNIDGFGYVVSKEGVKNTSDFLLEFGMIDKPVSYDEYVDPGAR